MVGPTERHSASIIITQNTTLQQLEAFTQQMGQGEKLRGIKNDDGSITLYSTDRNAKAWDKLTGKASERSQVGREAISMVMRNVSANQPEALTHVAELSKLINVSTNRSASTDTLAQMMALMKADLQQMPGLSDLPGGGQTVKTAITSIVNRLADLANTGGQVTTGPQNNPVISDATLKMEIQNLATVLHTALTDPQTALAFPNLGMAKSDILLDGVMEHLRNELGGMLETTIGVNIVKMVGTQAVEFGLGKLLPNQVTGDTTISINGQVYDKGRDLGQGAFGKVVEFVPRNGGDPVAVKYLKGDVNVTQGELFDLAKGENAIQQKANGPGSPNVLHSHGVMRTGDGSLAIITDVAPRGDAYNLMTNIKSMVQQGVITPQQGMLAAMTLAQDMTQGLAHMHGQGVAHIDFKPPNVFIDTDGVGKVADFGTSSESRIGNAKLFQGIDAPFWQAPEVLIGKEKTGHSDVPRQDLRDQAVQNLTRLFANVVSEGGRIEGGFQLDGDLVNNVTDDLEFQQIDTQFGADGIDPQSYDAFALGVSIYDFFFDDTIVPKVTDKFVFQYENEIKAFYGTGVDPIGTHTGALHQTTGFPEVDKLINSLMKTDPSQRSSVTGVLNHQAFNDPKIGSPEVRNLIKALASGDVAQINLAKALV